MFSRIYGVCVVCALGGFSFNSVADGRFEDRGDRIEHRLDMRGDRIEQHLTAKSDRISARSDNRAEQAAANGPSAVRAAA